MREHYKSKSQYMKLTEDTNKKIKLLIELISSEFKNVLTFLKEYSLQEAEIKSNEQNILLAEIISKISTKIQYQDILSQRLDHIILINNLIEEELKKTEQGNYDSAVLIAHSNKITDVNIRQLEDTYDEYISICSSLRKDLADFKKQSALKPSSSLGSYVPFKNSLQIGKLVSEIKQNLNMMASMSFEFSNITHDLDQTIIKVQSIYTMQSERDILYSCIPGIQEKIKITHNNDNDIFF